MDRANTTDAQSASGLRYTVVSCTFITFSLLVFLPLEVFTSNVSEFAIDVRGLLTFLLASWLFSTIVAILALLAIPIAFRYRVASLFLALGFLVWLQGNFLTWNYGPLDGSDIDWASQTSKGFIDSTIWVAGLAVAVAFPAALVRACYPLAVLLVLFQSVFVFAKLDFAGTSDSESGKRAFTIDYEQQYRFSKSTNVILIVLDAYQSDVFEEIIASDARYSEFFSGFTYFRNSLAGGNYTEVAIPALLTGQVYDNSEEREVFLRRAFLEHGLTTRLKEYDVQVEIYPWVGWGNESIYFDERIASNLTRVATNDDPPPIFTEQNAKEAIHLIDLALFRAAPHFLKRYIHNDYRWFIGFFASHMVPDNVKQVVSTEDRFQIHTFVNGSDTFSADVDGPVFKYFHFKGAHSPLTVDRNLEFSANVFPFSRENYIFQAKANLLALEQFFARLKLMGIYDSSIIAIVGDHGSGDSPEMYIVEPGESVKPYPLAGTRRNFLRDKARAIPLTLFKRSRQDGPLVVSDAPVALTDLPSTILREVGLSDASAGRSMFEFDASDSRVRYHSAFEFRPNKQAYVDEITLYRVSGSGWDNDSWSVEGILTKGGSDDGEQ